MKAPPSKLTSQSGLSLFELLIALALLAFISAALASSFSLGGRLFVRSTEIAALSDELALRARLRGWLASSAPPSLLAGFDLKFIGQNDHLNFVTLTATPFEVTAAGMAIAIKTKDNTVILTATTFDDDGKALNQYSETLANNVSNVSISYFTSSGETVGWQNSWENTTQLPELVRIEMDVGSRPDWPEFTVRLLMGG